MLTKIHACQCAACLETKEPAEMELHHQMNVFLSRLDEQQRRWYVVLESKKIGRGGDKQLSIITGMDVETSVGGGVNWMRIWPIAQPSKFVRQAVGNQQLKKSPGDCFGVRRITER